MKLSLLERRQITLARPRRGLDNEHPLHVIDLRQVEIAMEGADLKVNDLDAYRDSLIDQQRRDARARLQEIAEKLQAQGLAVSTEIEIGLPKQVIPRMVRRNDDLAHVVIGSRHALKLERMFRHNIAAKVQRKALCPVTVVELPARAGKQSLSDQNIKKF